MHISTIKNVKNTIFINGIILGIILFSILSLPITVGFNVRYGTCRLLTFSELSTSIYLLFAVFVFLIDLLIYLLKSFVFLPITGIIIAIKISNIKRTSKQLTSLSRKLHPTHKTDHKILVSQLFNSCFSIAFNIPLLITAFLNIGISI